MDKLAFIDGYFYKEAEDFSDEVDLELPKTPEEAKLRMLLNEEAETEAEAEAKAGKQVIKKEVAKIDAQLAALRALKKQKEISLYK